MKRKTYFIRMLWLALAVILILSLYALRLMQFQIVEGEKMIELIEQGGTSTQIIKAPRGEIFDRNGRPLAVNTIGRDVVIDQAYLERGSLNTVILRLISIMEDAGEDWIDNLPITDQAPFAFKQGEAYEGPITTLKKTLEIGQYATADDVMYHLRKKYNLDGEELDFTDEECRKIAGVRYEMTRCGFSMSVPYTFATNIKIETVPKIMERSFELGGVNVVESAVRQYVSGEIAPHLIGSINSIYKEQWDPAKKIMRDGILYADIRGDGQYYTMNDTIGIDGSEAAFESYLKGIDGKRQIVQNSRGEVLDVIDEQATIPGNTVVLTIDSRLQKVAQDALEQKILSMQSDLVHYSVGRGHEADAGALVAIDPKNGEILAAATYPSYDRTTYQRDYDELAASKPGKLFNRAFDAAYTPGSIFKPTVALGALNEGIVSPTDRVMCNMIYTRFPDYQPRCLDAHGNITVVDALRYSCNIFFYDAGYRLGIDKLDDYARRLGFGQPTGLELHESIGRMSSPELKEKLHLDNPNWVPGDTVQASIGQFDTLISPVQLANYCATLANDGKRMKVSLLKSVRSYALDETVYEHQPEIVENIDAPQAFATIREGMVAASRIGTSVSTFGNYKITVASKTGTPETAQFPNSTFIAYAPAEDPQIAICVIIEKGWHGYTGAPVARAVFDAYFSMMGDAADTIDGYNTLLA